MSDTVETDAVSFRHQGWGHSLHIYQDSEKGDGFWRGSAHSHTRLRAGMRIVWSAEWEGKLVDVVCLLSEVEPCRDPDDMYFIKGETIRVMTAERNGLPPQVLYQKPDQSQMATFWTRATNARRRFFRRTR